MFSCILSRPQLVSVLGICTILATELPLLAQTPTGPGRTTLYNEMSDDPVLDRAAGRVYAARFHIVEVKPGQDYSPARLKGHNPYFQDPRPMRELHKPARATVAYIITPQGTVIEPRVIEPSDSRLAEHVIKFISRRRFAPARHRGAAVFSVGAHQLSFPGSTQKENSSVRNGLGIMGYRDR